MVKRTKRKKRTNSKFIFIPFIAILGMIAVGFLAIYYQNVSNVTCANSISCIDNLSGNYDKSTKGVYMGNVVDSMRNLAQENTENNNQQVLGNSIDEKKHIYVDLSTQTLYAYDGNQLVYNFPVSTGKWSFTPTGDFKIWIKLRYTRMSGGNPSIGTYYNLPNVPFTMFFYNNKISKAAGYGLHGAYWHNNFGHPMSHGCINLGIEDAGKLYYWANPPTNGNITYALVNNPGTLITVYGKTPIE